jgi:hypothetical protein
MCSRRIRAVKAITTRVGYGLLDVLEWQEQYNILRDHESRNTYIGVDVRRLYSHHIKAFTKEIGHHRNFDPNVPGLVSAYLG